MTDDQAIFFPELAAEALAEAYSEGDQAEQEVIRTVIMLGNAAKGLSKTVALPERVAWLHLWSRGWEIANGLRGTLVWPSAVVLHALARSTTELHLHLALLGDVLTKGLPEAEHNRRSDRTAAIRAALSAYLAWILDSDVRHSQEVERHLEPIYDPGRAREFLRSLGPEGAEKWQLWFGEIGELSDQEAELDRAKGTKVLAEREQRLGDWLGHPALVTWRDRLRTMKHPNLPDLLMGTPGTARQQLRSRGAEFGYSQYQLDSQAIHGNRFDAFVYSGQDGFAPAAVVLDPTGAAIRIAEEVRLAALTLMVVGVTQLSQA